MQLDIRNIADKDDMNINGYAFTNENGWIRVLNLGYPNHAAVIYNGRIVETNMDDINFLFVPLRYNRMGNRRT